MLQVGLETRRVKLTAHAYYAVLRKASSLQREVSHRVHWVGDDDDDGFGRMLQQVLRHAFYNLGVGADELLTRHAGLAGDARCDDAYGRTCRLAVIVRRAAYAGVKAEQRRGLHNVQRLAFGEAFLDVHQYQLFGQLFARNVVCACGAYCAGAYYGYFHLDVFI